MSKPAAVIQIIVVALIVIYSTYQFYRGNFELAFATLPFLMVYYVFVFGRFRRNLPSDREDSPEDDTGS
jgi:hypothetical protein